MTAKKKKKAAPRKRRRRPTLSAAPMRRRATRRRKIRRALSSGGGGGGTKKPTIMSSLGVSLKGGIGGLIYVGPKFLFKMPAWVRISYGLVGAATLAYFKAPALGAGMAGAAVHDFAQSLFSVALKDDLEDAEYVDPNTLSDTGYADEETGNRIYMSDTGKVYALSDDGQSAQQIGTIDDLPEELQDSFNLSANNIQSVSSIPLSENPYDSGMSGSYALSGNYALSSGY